MDYIKQYEKWLISNEFDEETKNELSQIKGNEKEIEDRFYKELEFGTAGLRGIVGAGTNRMNKYTVGKATQGLANYILKKGKQDKGVAIAYDSRNMSKEFSKQAALILNANGIKTYLFDELRPTPELSFAVRQLNCVSGIVITASHNPPKYNGYKVYWEDGAQIFTPIDKEILEEIHKINSYLDIKTIKEEEAISKGLFNIIGKEIDDKYIEAIKTYLLNSELIKKKPDNLKIVYTPLHGTGYKLAHRILKEIGFSEVYTVESQKEPDPNFSTVSYPNPEDPKSFKLALELAKEVDADIVLANDPDADRIGLHVKDKKTGKYILFNGNMIGLTIAEYLISQNKKNNTLPKNSALIKTIVSSNMTDVICKEYEVEMYEVLTGFKNIAAKIRELEHDNTYKCIMGYEESYGCLIGDHARDKDGIVAVMLLCEAAAYYKDKGMTLWDNMNSMYNKYGYYKEGQISIVLEGVDGATKIKNMMTKLRDANLNRIGEYEVISIKDYESSKIQNLRTKEEKIIELPRSNVLYYELENDFWCAARPSGTEPKIKFYMGVKGNNLRDAEAELDSLGKTIKEIIEQ